MDYQAIDRDMSSWLVSCVVKGTRFYLTDELLATDISYRAKRYRWEDEAKGEALYQRGENWGPEFKWAARRVAQDMAERR
jgi:hypothetical protein